MPSANVDADAARRSAVQDYARTHFATEAVVISAQIESELVDLSEEEAQEYLRDLGVAGSGVSALIRAVYHLLGLRTYLTTGEQETRAWTIRAGDKAPAAAGVIHTDFERGFIAAETVHFDDLVALGSFAKAREAGKLRIEGKEYVVQTATWWSSASTSDAGGRSQPLERDHGEEPYRSLLRRVKNPAALFAAHDLLPVLHPMRSLRRHLHVAAGANLMLERDDGRIAFAREKPLEAIEQIFVDLAGQLGRVPSVNSCRRASSVFAFLLQIGHLARDRFPRRCAPSFPPRATSALSLSA